MTRLGGSVLAPDGLRAMTEAGRAALTPEPAAVLFVQSHHAVQSGMLALAPVVALARERGVPVLVDAAAEEDLRRYVAAGVDLVAYSGGKAFAGPTSGFVAGRAA